MIKDFDYPTLSVEDLIYLYQLNQKADGKYQPTLGDKIIDAIDRVLSFKIPSFASIHYQLIADENEAGLTFYNIYRKLTDVIYHPVEVTATKLNSFYNNFYMNYFLPKF